jgi:hypothetical protein
MKGALDWAQLTPPQTSASKTDNYKTKYTVWEIYRVVEIITTTTVSKRVVDEEIPPTCPMCFDSGLDYNKQDCDHKL